MGETHEYTCAECGYTATAAGSVQYGFLYVTLTIACQDCQALHDVNPDQDAEAYIAGGCEPRALTGVRCPEESAHLWTFWNEGDACPKCAGAMEVTGVGCCWD